MYILEVYGRHSDSVTLCVQDNKVSGVVDSSRILGYSFLCPSVTPKPHVSTVSLGPQDEFLVLGSRGLWELLSADEAVEAVRAVADALAAAKKLVTLAQSYGCSDSLSAVVVRLSLADDCCSCCEAPAPPSSPGPPAAHTSCDAALPPPGGGSELSSEFSTSEMSSEVGSTASSEEPAPQVEPLPTRAGSQGVGGGFRRQFSRALSDHGVDSEDEEPVAGVFSNGSRVEVEADVHCRQRRRSSSSNSVCCAATQPQPLPLRDPSPATSPPGGRRVRPNGSVARQVRSQDLIEEAGDAPIRKPGGYFNAPAQPDPDDQLVIPPELEEEVRQIIQQQQLQTHNQQGHAYQNPADYFVTPL